LKKLICRVAPGVCDTRASDLRPVSALTRLDLPALERPTKATSFTVGTVVQPNARTTITIDYWSTKITNVIVPVQATPEMITQYYANNGVVNVPGVTVSPGVADPDNPRALPLLGTISGSYTNADGFIGKGIDFSATIRNVPLGKSGVTWTTQANASLLLKLSQTNQDGSVSVYDGTLGPCNITSCSGAPRWRAAWANTFNFNDRARVTLTANYTSGYSSVATDSGGILGNCQASGDNGQLVEYPDGTPVQCRGKAVFNLDGHFEIKPTSSYRIYLDVKNILNSAPPYEPNAAYGLYQFNPAWGDSLFIGRYFRLGVKIDI
jgi:iron complex outermembrane receptor protein